MKTKEREITNFYEKRLATLVGSKIVDTWSDSVTGFFGVIVQYPDKSRMSITFMSDDEGNGPGSFDLYPIVSTKPKKRSLR